MADYGVRVTFFSEGKTTIEFLGGDAEEVDLNTTKLIELGESNEVIAQALVDTGLTKKAKPEKKEKRRRDEEEDDEPDDDDDDDDDDDEEEEAPRRRRSGTRKRR